MPRNKTLLGYFGMCAEYDVVETTTHKTVLEDGYILRTDMDGFYILQNPEGQVTSSWLGFKDSVWDLRPQLVKKQREISEFDWVEEPFKRQYEMERDVS